MREGNAQSPLDTLCRNGIRRTAVGVTLSLVLSSCGGLSEVDNGHCPVTAARSLDWGSPNREDTFDAADALDDWIVYDGAGHAGNGRRTPSAMSVNDGMLTISGDSWGNTGGMGWLPGQLHGRWEACIKSSPATEAYHSLALLWPDAENWPTGGEVDFMEVVDPARRSVEFWLHWGPGGDKTTSEVRVDAAEWHSYAVEWTPSHLIYYLDGEPEWLISDPANLPPGPMHLCVQLDYFGGDAGSGAHQWVDWVRQYDSAETGEV